MNKKLLSVMLATTILAAGALQAAPKGEKGGEMEAPVKVEKVEKARRLGKKHHQEMAERMAKDLGLTAEQRQKADELRKKSQEKIKPLMDEMKDLREKIDAERKANMEEFEDILTPEQKQKFEEIKERGAKDFKKRREEVRNIMRGRGEGRDFRPPHEREYERMRGHGPEHEGEFLPPHRRGKWHEAEHEGDILPPPPPPADDEAPIPPMPLLEDEGVLPPPPEAE